MSMLVLQPTAVTDSMVLSSSAVEDATAAYVASTVYPAGQRVHRTQTHRVYECLLDGTTGYTPEDSPTRWHDVGPTNRYALFDSVLQTVTAGEVDQPLVVELQPGPVEGVMLAGLSGAAWVQVDQLDAVGGDTVYSQVQRLDSVAITDHRTWSTAPFKYRSMAFFSDLQPYLAGVVRVTVQPISGQAASVGVLAVGAVADVGSAQKGISFGGITYSRIDTDAYGTTTITRRANTRDLNFELLLPLSQLDTAAQVLEDAKTTPSGFVPSTAAKYDALLRWGLVESWTATLPEAEWVTVRGRIKGLI